MIFRKKDISKAMDAGKKIPGIQGLLMIKNDHIGAWGDLKLVQI